MNIKAAHFNSSITIPGSKVLGVTAILPIAKAEHASVKLTWCSDGLMVESQGITALVPAHNVRCLILDKAAPSGKSK